MKILNHITEYIGHTPVLSLKGLLPDNWAELYIKLEGMNPCGSIKDRPALNMILRAEQAGLLKPGGTIIESTSGNLGAALAMVAALRGYKCIILVDPKTNEVNKATLRALGAKVVVVTEKDPEDGSYQKARVAMAHKLGREIKGSYLTLQLDNPWNPEAHEKGTAKEIMETFPGGGPDAVVAAVSTTGQICGIAQGLKNLRAKTQTIAVDVKGSVVFGGDKKPWLVTGMGNGWVPGNLKERLIDEVYKVDTDICFSTARLLAARFGVLTGGSSGAALIGAMAKAAKLGPRKKVLAISSDRGEKYLQEFYNDDWLQERGFKTNRSVGDILSYAEKLAPFRRPSSEIQWAFKDKTLKKQKKESEEKDLDCDMELAV